MTQNMLLSTVLFASIVLQLTTATTAEWKSCFDDSCPIKNLEFPFQLTSKKGQGLSDTRSTSYSTINKNTVSFSLGYAESGGIDRVNAIAWGRGTYYVLFTCGPVISTTANNYIYPLINGTAIYINGKEYCSWSVDINNSSYPFELIDPPQYYISQSGYQIYYNLNQTVPIAAANYSQLPESVEPFVDGYRYKAVGSEKYLLVARQANKSIDFLLKVNGETPKLVEVNLKSDISVDIECNFEKRMVAAYAKIYAVKNNLWNRIQNVEMNENECRWSLPASFDTLYGPVNLKETAYELEMIENNMFVYFDGKNFRIETPKDSKSGDKHDSNFLQKIGNLLNKLTPPSLFDAAYTVYKSFQKF